MSRLPGAYFCDSALVPQPSPIPPKLWQRVGRSELASRWSRCLAQTLSPLEPCLQCQADSSKKNRCARDEPPAPELGFPPLFLLWVPGEPVSGETYRHAHFPYPDGPSRTGSLVKDRPHVLRVRAL